VLPNHLDHIERDNHGIRALEMSAQEKGQHTDTKSLSPELDQTESELTRLPFFVILSDLSQAPFGIFDEMIIIGEERVE
jgi:GTPase involved in cell partitioning and DNA repair